jgi:hypothetical protein
LYEPASAGELASALRRLIEDPGLVRALRAHILQSVRVKTIGDDAREWTQAYVEVLGRRAAAPFTA